jgi:hypothetical protein
VELLTAYLEIFTPSLRPGDMIVFKYGELRSPRHGVFKGYTPAGHLEVLLDGFDGYDYPFIYHPSVVHDLRVLSSRDENEDPIYLVNGIWFHHGEEIEFELPSNRNIKGYIMGYDDISWVRIVDHFTGRVMKCNVNFMRNVRRMN